MDTREFDNDDEIVTVEGSGAESDTSNVNIASNSGISATKKDAGSAIGVWSQC